MTVSSLQFQLQVLGFHLFKEGKLQFHLWAAFAIPKAG